MLSPRGTVRSCYLGNSGTANGFLVSPKEDQIEKLNEMMKRKVQKEKKRKVHCMHEGKVLLALCVNPSHLVRGLIKSRLDTYLDCMLDPLMETPSI